MEKKVYWKWIEKHGKKNVENKKILVKKKFIKLKHGKKSDFSSFLMTKWHFSGEFKIF